MAIKAPLNLSKAALNKLSKSDLIQIILELQQTFFLQVSEKDKRLAELTKQLIKLSQEQKDQKKKALNLKVNQPSSKKPEWDKDGNPLKSKSNKKAKRKRKRKKRPGCGNKPKSTLKPDHTDSIALDICPECANNLNNKDGRDNPARIIEDILPPAEKTTVFEEITESKWCSDCKKMVSSKSEKALSGSDIGLNATIEMAYLWVMCSLSLPNIQSIFKVFKSCKISTAGISKIMIRLSTLLQPVYEEILNDVKQEVIIWADETGWRVKGKLWWLWIFANKRSAYYWPDPSRGGAVVERILGPLFLGVIIVDGWHAYNKIVCAKQTCMSHIFRKIRAFIDAYPEYRSIMTFYLKLRRIIRDGQKLQTKRHDVDEVAFQRRLKRLKQRLDDLLAWNNPNEILENVIKKVRRQQDHILTFIEYDGAEHHNNYAEYIIKKGVLKRKISGGSKSEEGFRAYACLQSVAMTCQLRNISFSHFMKECLVQYIHTETPMLLSEYETRFNRAAEKAA